MELGPSGPGAVSTDQAASGAGVSEAGTELGGALGIALLGSIGAAAYRTFAADHLPAAAVHTAAAGSLPGALTTAAGLPAGLAQQVLAAGRDAYVHGLHVAAAAGAVVLLLAAVGLVVGPRAGARRTPVTAPRPAATEPG